MDLSRFHVLFAMPSLDGAIVVGNKVLNTLALPVDSWDHKIKVKKMGEVIALIRVMPSEVLKDDELNKMINDIKKTIKEPIKLGRIEIKDIAFGLKGVNVTVSVPDAEGGLDPIVKLLSHIDNVDNAEVVDVGRV